MSKFIIRGGKKLNGEVTIKGMKNAATPILAATLLTEGSCLIDNLPQISDVSAMLDILKSLGSKIEKISEGCLRICNKGIDLKNLDQKLVKKMRSSVLFMGPLLARFGSVEISEPGGCIIGNRPLGTHFYALEKLGAKIIKEEAFYKINADKLIGSLITLPEFSVTATENAIMAAVLAHGKTTIKLAAAEPHVQDLCLFLNKMGASVSGIGTHILIIEGVKKLKGAEHHIIPDQIEAGTFAVAASLTRGHVLLKNIEPEHLDIILLKLNQVGINFEIRHKEIQFLPSSNLKSFRLQSLPYPGFPTDLQAPFGVLATQCQGTTLIHDPLFEGRMGYIQELVKMGANAIVADPHRVIVNGPTPLYGQEIRSFDLRAGATLIIAGLIAQGETIINQAEIVDRGYEKIEERLNSLGAEIKRIED